VSTSVRDLEARPGSKDSFNFSFRVARANRLNVHRADRQSSSNGCSFGRRAWLSKETTIQYVHVVSEHESAAMISARAAKVVVKLHDTLPTACRSGVVANGADLLETVMITGCGLVRCKLQIWITWASKMRVVITCGASGVCESNLSISGDTRSISTSPRMSFLIGHIDVPLEGRQNSLGVATGSQWTA